MAEDTWNDGTSLSGLATDDTEININRGDGSSKTFKIKEGKTTVNTLVTVQQDGKVGIGIDPPTEKLHVSGNVKVDGGFIELDTISTPSDPSDLESKLFLKKNGVGPYLSQLNLLSTGQDSASNAVTHEFKIVTGPIFNVKEYGAVGDGAVDDSDAIIRAVSDFKAADGGKLIFPPGIYRITETIDFTGFTGDTAGHSVVEGIGNAILYLYNVNSTTPFAGEAAVRIGDSSGRTVEGNVTTCIFNNIEVRSNLLQWYTYITASDVSSTGITSFSAANTVDQSTSTIAWNEANASSGDTVDIDLGVGVDTNYFALGIYMSAANSDTEYSVQYLDGTWKDAITGFVPNENEMNYCSWPQSSTKYRYWRIKVTTAGSTSNDILAVKLFDNNVPGFLIDGVTDCQFLNLHAGNAFYSGIKVDYSWDLVFQAPYCNTFNGIEFNGSSENAVTIQGGRMSSFARGYGRGFFVSGSANTISGVNIEAFDTGIYTNAFNALSIQGNYFEGVKNGVEIYAGGSTVGCLISNNYISGPNVSGVGKGIALTHSTAATNNCRISNNYIKDFDKGIYLGVANNQFKGGVYRREFPR